MRGIAGQLVCGEIPAHGWSAFVEAAGKADLGVVFVGVVSVVLAALLGGGGCVRNLGLTGHLHQIARATMISR
jgi:hypothetical protein